MGSKSVVSLSVACLILPLVVDSSFPGVGSELSSLKNENLDENVPPYAGDSLVSHIVRERGLQRNNDNLYCRGNHNFPLQRDKCVKKTTKY